MPDFLGHESRPRPTNNFAANTQFSGVTFDSTAGTFTLSGNAVNLAGSIVNSGTNTQTINLNLLLQQDVNLSLAGGNLVIGGIVSGGNSITVSALAPTILTASNTYAGGTTINGGTLQVGSGGSGAGAVRAPTASRVLRG